MSEVPDELWPQQPYKRGDRRPPMIHFGFILKSETVSSFFCRFSHQDVESTIKKFNLTSHVPQWSYIEHITSDIIGRNIYVHPVYLNGYSADVLSLWDTYNLNGKRDRVLTEEEKKLSEVFGQEPAWYLDAMFPDWDRKPSGI